MHRGKEADMSLLQGEGGPEEDVQQSLGKASCHVWTAARLASILGSLAACHHWPGTRHQLHPGPRVIRNHIPGEPTTHYGPQGTLRAAHKDLGGKDSKALGPFRTTPAVSGLVGK